MGYALTVLHRGSDDTFPLGAGYAELYTLAVLQEWRGSGVGTALLDAVAGNWWLPAFPRMRRRAAAEYG